MPLFDRHRAVAPLRAFDPEEGQTILSPEKEAPHYWIGCPSVLYEPDRGRFLLSYRERKPRGEEAERGWRVGLAESTDGVSFHDIWAVEKHELETSSMERASLLPKDDGGYLLYLSYVDPIDSRWRIDVLESETPEGFTVGKRVPALTSADAGTEGVKDPVTLRVGPAVYLYTHVARARDFTAEERQAAHATEDIHAVGVTTLPTGLAVSQDGGRHFQWCGEVLDVGAGWDSYQARLNSILPVDGAFLGFHDGAASVEETYEERCGIALSFDLRSWAKLTPNEPWVTSPHASGSIRYLDVVPVNEELFFYYEYARADGSHELRLNRVPRHAVSP